METANQAVFEANLLRGMFFLLFSWSFRKLQTSLLPTLQALLEREELNKAEIEAIIAANPPDQPWEELTAGEPYELWDRDWQNSPYLIKYGAFDLTSDLVPDYVRPLPKLPPNEQRLLDETRQETSIMTQ